MTGTTPTLRGSRPTTWAEPRASSVPLASASRTTGEPTSTTASAGGTATLATIRPSCGCPGTGADAVTYTSGPFVKRYADRFCSAAWTTAGSPGCDA